MQSLLSLFLAARCPLCDRPSNNLLCRYCQNQLHECELENPLELWQGDLPVFVWGNYEGVLKRAIAALKYANKPEIGEILGQLLAQSWLNNLPATPEKLVVIPIPLHSDKLHQRGYNQAAIIARAFAQINRFSYQERGLIRIRNTKAQFGLSISQRTENLANAFSVGKQLSPNLRSRAVLLIDDIYTTGATARAASETLRQSGATVCGLAAIATPKKAARSP